MSNQSICIDSPFFRLPPFHPLLRIEPQPHPEEPEIPLFRFMLASPDILPPALGPVSSLPHTPWAARLCGEEGRGRDITLPSVFEGEDVKMEAIEERILYSEIEEDYELMTPVRGGEGLLKEENSSLQLLTTGRKQDSEPLQSAEVPRNCKMGLRRLSARAYRIVQDVRNATYKDVAERLVRELKHCEAELGEEREEQNVKRRVYDALNVLVAVGVLRREGRKVAAHHSHQKRAKTHSALRQLQIEQLSKQIEAKAGRVDALRQKLGETEEKLQSVKWLLTKNRQSGQGKDQSIPFPFIAITLPPNSSAQQPSPSQVVIRSERPICPFGDIDTLRCLNTR